MTVLRNEIERMVVAAERVADRMSSDYPGVDPCVIESAALESLNRSIDDYQEATSVSFRDFAKVRMRNAARDALRHEVRRMKRSQPMPEEVEFAARPDSEINADEFWRSATAGLPDDQRIAVNLVFRVDVTHAEAASIIGCTVDRVRHLVRSAMPAIRRNLADHAA